MAYSVLGCKAETPRWRGPLLKWMRRHHARQARLTICRDAYSKCVWVETSEKEVFTTSVEAGFTTFLARDGNDGRLDDWRNLAAVTTLTLEPAIRVRGQPPLQVIVEHNRGLTHLKGVCVPIPDGKALQDMLARDWEDDEFVLVDAPEWPIISAESLVANFQGSKTKVMAYANSAADARVLLEALEVGTHGVVLRTNDPKEPRKLAAYLQQHASNGAAPFEFAEAVVTRVDKLGMGDRVCVDMCSSLQPGEGLLVGNFSRALFLVHSECAESSYISSRPFRVNAGPVHSYLQASNDRTAYLSELRAGSDALVVDAHGRHRSVIVGRCKVELRPLVMISVETEDNREHSIIVQNAETVKLVGPSRPSMDPQESGSSKSSLNQSAKAPVAAECGKVDWQAIPVTTMQPGDILFCLIQDSARHTGVKIDERINER